MRRVLVYFTGFSAHVGGSEYLLFALIQALQKGGCSVTVALQSAGDLGRVAKTYGMEIDLSTLTILRFVRARQLRKMGPQFDFCISCANPVDFGRPGIHFVHMMTLDAGYFNKVWFRDQGKAVPLKMRLSQWRDTAVRLLSGVRSAWQIVRDSREIVLPNSNFVKRSIEAYYKCRVHDAFYPPTLIEPLPTGGTPVAPGVMDVACLGRVGPEKKVLEIIDIVERARRLTGTELRLRIAGRVPPADATNTDYGRRVRTKAAECPWITLEGVLIGEAKAKYLSECRFAVHACEVEAFGISVTEYLKAGVVPIVPKAGGSSEVVNDSELVYDSVDVAVDLLVRLVMDETFWKQKQASCRARSEVFSAENYRKRQMKLLKELGVIG